MDQGPACFFVLICSPSYSCLLICHSASQSSPSQPAVCRPLLLLHYAHAPPCCSRCLRTPLLLLASPLLLALPAHTLARAVFMPTFLLALPARITCATLLLALPARITCATFLLALPARTGATLHLAPLPPETHTCKSEKGTRKIK